MKAFGIAAALLLVTLGAWGSLLLWYRLPGGAALRTASSGGLAILVLISAALLVLRGTWAGAAVTAALLGGLLVWFVTLRPGGTHAWATDVSRPLRAEIDGSTVVLRDVRNFVWRTNEDVTPRWEDRTYDLDALSSVDLINSYWMGPAIAHTLLSFGFADGRYLAFSIEIRRAPGEEFSNLAGFFKRYELVVIGADERDIVLVRSNVRDEDVRIYRVKAEPAQIRGMFRALLERANHIAATPAFYDTLRSNCTTEMFGAAREVAPDLPWSWRIILSGYLPDYAYDNGLLDRRLAFAALRRRARIVERARAAGDDPDFSARIRDGIPDPNR